MCSPKEVPTIKQGFNEYLIILSNDIIMIFLLHSMFWGMGNIEVILCIFYVSISLSFSFLLR